MELLAPAGSKEAFISALRAGADSVYIGVDRYNARLNADTFNIYDLEVAVNYVHSHDKKVYLALNTLIKHSEINDVVKTLYSINKFKPDAVIVQDIGIAGIIKEQFPEIMLHASTQLAVHNSYGVKVLSKLGFNRVILARELSFPELKLIALKSPVGLEVFCHGALCFCISGMCLFSSVIGAHSGNRGRCTQPCRRIWVHGSKRGYLFSPKDLELAEYIPSLKKAGISALKIEGRMRSSEYVNNTVKAYRLLIDADESNFTQALEEARGILSRDWAREKTSFLFSGKNSAVLNPDKPQCLGRKIGTVIKSGPGFITIETAETLQRGDRIRVSDPDSDTTESLTIKEISKSGNALSIPFAGGEFSPGSQVFKAGDAAWDEKNIEKEVDMMYSSYARPADRKSGPQNDYSNKYASLIARQWITGDKNSSEQLWVRIDDPGWIAILPGNIQNLNVVLSLKRENIGIFKEICSEPFFDCKNIVCELTPYISQREIAEYRQFIDRMIASGINRWVLNNISQFGFFPSGDIEITAGHFLYTWNAFSARVLKDMGAYYFVTSWEDDILNIRKLAEAGLRSRLIVYLYGYPPVARSRMLSKDTYSEGIFSQQDIKLKMIFESGAGVLIPDKPVMLFNAREKLGLSGIRNFGIDLSYVKPENALWENIYGAYQKKTNLPDSIKFNFKRAVK
jgi:putative protease